MSDDRKPSTGQNARLLRALIWAGLGLAPVAAVVVMLGGEDAARFAVVLTAVSVVLVGAAMLVRTDPVLGRMDVEDRVADGVEALRSQIRAENAAASRAMLQQVQSLAEEVGRLRGGAAPVGGPREPGSGTGGRVVAVPSAAARTAGQSESVVGAAGLSKTAGTTSRPMAGAPGTISRAVPVASGAAAAPRPVGEGTGGRASAAVAAGRIPVGGRASAPGWPEGNEPRWGRPDATPGWEDDDHLPLPGESSGTRGSIPLQRTGSLPSGGQRAGAPPPPIGPGQRSGPVLPAGPGQRSGPLPLAGTGQRVPPSSRPPVPATGRGGEYGAPRSAEGSARVYGSSRPAGHDEASGGGSWSDPGPSAESEARAASGAWADSGAWGDAEAWGESGALGGSGAPGDGSRWGGDEPDSGGWVADDPGYAERRWTDEESGSYRRDDGPEPRRPAVYGTPAGPEPAQPHKRRADVTAIDLGYTGRRTRSNHAGPDYAGPDYAGPDYAGPDYAGPDYAGPNYAGSDYAGSDYAGSDHAGLDYTGPDAAGSDYTELSYPEPGYPEPDHTGPDQVAPDRAELDQAGLNRGGPNRGGPNHVEAKRAEAKRAGPDRDRTNRARPNRAGAKRAELDAAEPEDDDGAYWRRLAAEPDDW